jgi:type I restriction enzyme S subunit
MSESVDGIPQMGRTKVKLGDIARNISENEYKPKEKGLDRCVGLEHLDPGSLKIHRWSPITPEMSFTRRFCKGQILFGKRRAYQKKVALADFDGICSSDILVIEAKKENFVPELMPFIIQDDRFFEFAVGTSSGSLSPRTKWKFLSEYEIWLPPLDEQRRIATTLWAAEDCITNGERFVIAAERAKQVLMKVLFSKGIGHTEFQQVTGFGNIPKRWNVHLLSEISSVKTGPFGAQLHQKDYVDAGWPIITVEHLGDISVLHENLPLISDHDKKRLFQYVLNEGDIVFSRVGSIDRNCLITYKEVGWLFSGRLLRVRPDKEKVISTYLNSYFNFEPFKQRVRNVAVGGTMPSLNTKLLSDISIPLPPIPEQHQIAAILTRCDETIVSARMNVTTTKALKMKMINEMLKAGN